MKKQLESIYRNAVIEALDYLQKYIEEANEKKYWWDIEKYSDYPTMDYFDSGLPRFSLYGADKIDYSQILHKDSACENFKSWIDYYNYVCSSEALIEFYGKQYFDDSLMEIWKKVYTFYQLSHFACRHIYLNENKISFNENIFTVQYEKWYKTISEKKLTIDFYIPILLTTFDFEEARISENIFIQKMDEKLQLSRNQKVSYIDSSKETVASAATHALVLTNWVVDNSNCSNREKILNELNSYNQIIDIVETFFSIFRVKTGVYSGFSQIVGIAKDWEDNAKADLYQTYVVSTRKYPDFFDNYGWLNKPQTSSLEDVAKISDYYSKVSGLKQNRTKLALSRLNTAYLRSREEDTILDITIAFETVLTHDVQTEITYRLASRVAALCSVRPFKDFSQFQVFEFCKKIYSYRSAVVHGDQKKIGKTKMIKTHENNEIETISISIELLRHVIGILIDYPDFNDPIAIDKLKFKN